MRWALHQIALTQTFVLGRPPIESRLRLPATDLMYEVCRVQKLSSQELEQFDDAFIDHLFEMVETTRDNQDERLNYAVIRLIVSGTEDELTPGRAQRAIHGCYAARKETLYTDITYLSELSDLA